MYGLGNPNGAGLEQEGRMPGHLGGIEAELTSPDPFKDRCQA